MVSRLAAVVPLAQQGVLHWRAAAGDQSPGDRRGALARLESIAVEMAVRGRASNLNKDPIGVTR